MSEILHYIKFFRIHFSNKYSTKVIKPPEVDDDLDESIAVKYSTSPASKYKASETIHGKANERLWYEIPVIFASLAIFLIYFSIREENDIDAELDRSLYSRIDGLEELQLKLSLKYNQEQGKDTKDIEQRLKEIELEKTAKAEATAN